MTDRCLWKHYLTATSLAAGKYFNISSTPPDQFWLLSKMTIYRWKQRMFLSRLTACTVSLVNFSNEQVWSWKAKLKNWVKCLAFSCTQSSSVKNRDSRNFRAFRKSVSLGAQAFSSIFQNFKLLINVATCSGFRAVMVGCEMSVLYFYFNSM